MDETAIASRAAKMLAARREQRSHESFGEKALAANVDEAYAIQDAYVAAFSDTPIGWKIGCTSKRAQQVANTNEPFYGRMFAATLHDSPATISARPLIAPIAEPEIAVRLASDLSPAEAPFSIDDVQAAIAAMYPAFEIVDCRFDGGWPNIDLIKCIADNGVHAHFVLGPEVVDWHDIDRPTIPVVAELNGQLVTRGVGGNALGDPFQALVWLANNCASRGHGLKAGELVTTGNLGDEMIAPRPGDVAVAKFGGLGAVQVSFAGD